MRSHRGVRLAAVLLGLLLLGGAPAAAYEPPSDRQTGSVGPVIFRDFAYGSHRANIDCVYRKLDNGQRRIKRFTIRPPQVWWPDTDSSDDDQRGTVGFRYRLQEATDRDGSWTTVYTSSVQKRTAREGAYDTSRDAPFTTRTLDWSSSRNVVYRIRVTVTWYKSNGDVRGTLDHWYRFYDSNYYSTALDGACRNKPTVQ